MENTKKVAIIMGSDSDWPTVKAAAAQLKSWDIPFEVRVMSAHRTPAAAAEFAKRAAENGFGVIIAAAGMAAHLAGSIAANTVLPVVGIPVKGGAVDGLDALLATLDKTILTEEGKCAMTDAEKFEGFKQKLVAENEAEYGAEARGKYGDTAVDASNAKLMGLSPEQYGEMQKLSARINAALAAAVRAGEAPDGPEGRRIAGLHKQWLCFTWPKYTPKAHLGLAEMYVADERFTAYYDAETPGCAAFLRDAVASFTGC